MALRKTSIRIDEGLWEQVKAAAEQWAIREGLEGSGMTAKWLTRVLRRAVQDETQRP